MKAVLKVNLKASSAEESQRVLLDFCERMKREDLIDQYHFEIETPSGPVTEKCLIAGQKVIA